MTPTQILILALARACVGEAGWDSADSGECAAVTFVHLKRARDTGADPARTVQKYSAALKTGKHTWIRGLSLDGRRPKTFPRNLNWDAVHAPRWQKVLDTVRGILDGRILDPCPESEIYGSRQDWEIKTWRGFARVCADRGWGNQFGKKE
jgi:hypothetical protein